MSKRYLFIGFNEDFEDTTVKIYEAESEDDVVRMLQMEFFGVDNWLVLDALLEEDENVEDWERFEEMNPYKIVPIEEIDVKVCDN